MGNDPSSNPVLGEYLRRTEASAAVGARAEQVMPAGETRAAGYHPPYPLTLVRGQGAKVTDADGHDYWDLLGNYTSLVHGHGFAPVAQAAASAIESGTAWPARNLPQIELAELLCDRVASIERVRYANSGSEATMLAVQVARVATGRSAVLMARYGYHGVHEDLKSGTFEGVIEPVPGSGPTFTAPFGDLDAFEAVLVDHGDQIAAVIVEGVMGASGIISAPPSFFMGLADAAHRAGAVFVLDEVITLRLAHGGHQQILGVAPDLTTMAKIIGGGFPVGALGGREDLMALLDPRNGRIYHSGTFNGNPVTCAAGIATLEHLTPEAITELDRLGRRLADGLTKAAADAGLPFSLRQVGSLLNLYVADEPAGANPVRSDAAEIQLLHLAAMNHGLYFSPRGTIALSTPLGDTAVDDITTRFAAASTDVAAQLGVPS